VADGKARRRAPQKERGREERKRGGSPWEVRRFRVRVRVRVRVAGAMAQRQHAAQSFFPP
jgi:hypothetical protein